MLLLGDDDDALGAQARMPPVVVEGRARGDMDGHRDIWTESIPRLLIGTVIVVDESGSEQVFLGLSTHVAFRAVLHRRGMTRRESSQLWMDRSRKRSRVV